MIWQSEALLYGMMIANGVAVGCALVWAWRRGHLTDMEAAGEVLFDDSNGEHSRLDGESE